jgi:rod shape-determining protein MreD
MSSRVMPFRGSLTSREQVAVHEFSWPAVIFIPLVAVLIQIFIPVRARFLPIIDLPFMVTIFFAVARRNPITGCLTGCAIGLMQDLFAGPGPIHPLGMYGIALTIVGYLASSLGLKIDVENPGSRFILTYIFFVAHQGIYYGVAHGLLRQAQQWSWSHVAISALANAVIGIFVFRFLDRFKQR